MAYRNKVYVAFDGDKDISYYYLMKAWKQNDNSSFNFYDAHDLTSARDTSAEETIKRSLRERLNNSKVFVLLVGESTRYLYKFVKWEIETARNMGLPIIVVNLNGLRIFDESRCPASAKNIGAVHISYNSRIMQHALENWPSYYLENKSSTMGQNYEYKKDIYAGFGI